MLNKEKKGEEEDEELFQVNINAAKTSKRVETFLDEVLVPMTRSKFAVNEKYDQFKGQFLQYFEQFLGLPPFNLSRVFVRALLSFAILKSRTVRVILSSTDKRLGELDTNDYSILQVRRQAESTFT